MTAKFAAQIFISETFTTAVLKSESGRGHTSSLTPDRLTPSSRKYTCKKVPVVEKRRQLFILVLRATGPVLNRVLLILEKLMVVIAMHSPS